MYAEWKSAREADIDEVINLVSDLLLQTLHPGMP